MRRRRRPPETARGALVLIGGAASPSGPALAEFVRRADAAAGGLVVGLTTASADPAGSADAWRRDLEAAGARDTRFPLVVNRAQARSREVVALIREARGIFLGGGDQIHLIATIGGSPLEEAIYEAYCRGAVVCGTSAGAAALTETTLANGEVDEDGNLIEMYIGPGLGLLGYRTMIDTHFAQRRRLQRLFVAIAGYPELLGLGIDEDTALVVEGHVGEVVGRGAVTFVDGRSVRFDNADEVRKGRQLTLSHLRVGIVGTGYRFDLRERELEVLLPETDAQRRGGGDEDGWDDASATRNTRAP
ncbi:MAG TPA: cyanophycinase [Gemmatimonadaceae bacterium]|nr:cyanophycinase [Gemmatimonadaceae bacterium]